MRLSRKVDGMSSSACAPASPGHASARTPDSRTIAVSSSMNSGTPSVRRGSGRQHAAAGCCPDRRCGSTSLQRPDSGPSRISLARGRRPSGALRRAQVIKARKGLSRILSNRATQEIFGGTIHPMHVLYHERTGAGSQWRSKCRTRTSRVRLRLRSGSIARRASRRATGPQPVRQRAPCPAASLRIQPGFEAHEILRWAGRRTPIAADPGDQGMQWRARLVRRALHRDEDPRRARNARRRPKQARLANAGFAHHDDPALAATRSQLSSSWSNSASRPTHANSCVWCASKRTSTGSPVTRHTCTGSPALDLVRAHVDVRKRHPPGVSFHPRRNCWLRQGLDPRSEVRRQPRGGVLFGKADAHHVADQGDAGCQPDMHIEVTAALEAFGREPVEDPEARANRALRAVLQCRGVSKIGQDAVSHHPSDEAVVVLDDARAQG